MMKIYKYTIPGDPIAETKVVNSESPRIWDSYKQRRFNYKQHLKNQHNNKPLFYGPIIIEATFYFKPPHHIRPILHDDRPSMHGLYNFLDKALQGVVYNQDCQIYETLLKKIFSDDPRTEIIIKRIE